MPPCVDLTGRQFGRLSVIKRTEGKTRGANWLCVCVCGKETVVPSGRLNSGKTTSCGCYRYERVFAAAYRHGMHATALHAIWVAMRQRCNNPGDAAFRFYGARGISVCERWDTNFENFAADMGDRPDGTSVDRFPNPVGNYEPGNCRWATNKEQGRNKINTKLSADKVRQIKALVKKGCRVAEVAEMFSVTPRHVYSIIAGQRWDP